MIINPTFLIKDPSIILGLLNGTLTRHGGVIREAATGQIVRHLVESSALTGNLMTLAANPLLGAIKIASDTAGHGITIHKLHQVSNQLNQVQQMLNPILVGHQVWIEG